VTGLLAPYRVLDLTDSGAELATFMMAGFGADVIKVEPSGGARSRFVGPAVEGEPPELASVRFHAYNRGKRSVVLDLDEAGGRSDFFALVTSADFVFENAGPGIMDQRGLGYDVLSTHRSDLVYVAISPFGQSGPYADHVATDLTIAAMGGAMALNGDRDRRPVRVTVPQTWHHAAAESVVGALVAHERRIETGEAQFVDVSAQAAVFWTGLNAMVASAIDGKNMERGGSSLQLSTLTTPLVHPCLDGEVCVNAMGATLFGLLPWMLESGAITDEWVAREDWATYEQRLLAGEELTITIDEWWAAVGGFTKQHTKAELFAGAIARKLTLVPVQTVADTVAMEQLTVREYWDDVALPSGRVLKAPGPFAKVSNGALAWTPAPTIGEHTEAILGELRRQPPIVPTPLARGRSLPLEGVKVADFSWIGVGPITAKALADNGATVVRIENESPIDRLRVVGPFKDGEFGLNRCQFFGSFNTSKLSLRLDLKHSTGADVARRLLAWCDVALDSFTAGTMDRLGLGYDAAREVNPNIIMATTCLFGQYGPVSQLAGYGYHAAAISGFYEVTGWPDRAPGGPWNAYTDTIAPRFLTSTLLAALDHRRRTGEGQYIDQAQMESALHFLAPELLDVQVSGRSARRDGNYSSFAAPHDAYPCVGDDQWIAIAIETDAQWRSLRSAMGEPAWAADTALDTLDGRRPHSDEIDRQLAEFTSSRDAAHLMLELQAAGVPAAMVQRSSDHLQDPQLAHRNFFRRMEHPEMGEVPYEGHQYAIRGYDNGPRLPAPCLGEHTYEVLTELLGLDDDQVADVLISGACG